MSTEVMSTAARPSGWRAWVARRAANLRGRLAMGLVADSVQLGMRRPAVAADAPPPTKLPLTVRAITEDDIAELLPADTRGLSRLEESDIQMRRQLHQLVPECGIAVVDERDGRVCFLQWLIGADRNDAIARLEGLPQLAQGELMLEGAYVPPAHRGRTASLAAAGVALAHASKLGATDILTFVGEAHSVSLRGVTRLGFRPYMLHVRRHLFFGLIKYDRFRPVSPDDPRFGGKYAQAAPAA